MQGPNLSKIYGWQIDGLSDPRGWRQISLAHNSFELSHLQKCPKDGNFNGHPSHL